MGREEHVHKLKGETVPCGFSGATQRPWRLESGGRWRVTGSKWGPGTTWYRSWELQARRLRRLWISFYGAKLPKVFEEMSDVFALCFQMITVRDVYHVFVGVPKIIQKFRAFRKQPLIFSQFCVLAIWEGLSWTSGLCSFFSAILNFYSWKTSSHSSAKKK